MMPGLGKAVEYRRDPSPDQSRTGGGRVQLRELARESLNTVERRHVADELRCLQLVFEDRFGEVLPHGVVKETAPRPSPRALQIDDRDLAVGGRQTRSVQLLGIDHLVAPKRVLRPLSPDLNKVETMVLTARVPWLSARNSARHSTELPEPSGWTPRNPV